MQMFALRCDYRENRGGCVIDKLRALRANEEVVRSSDYELRDEVLTTGDYVIQAGAHVLLIERKTWADLAASIKDGRIFNNHKKMLDGAAAGFRICYLIEGQAPSPDIAAIKVDGITIGSMMAKLDHFAFRDHVILEFTRNSAHTAARLLELGKHLCTLRAHSPTPTPAPAPATVDTLAVTTTSVDAIVKKKHVCPMAEVQARMLMCVPSIGEKTATNLLAIAPFADLVTAQRLPESALSKVAIAELRELGAGRREAVLVTMLQHIKGVSKTIASQIAAAYRPLGRPPMLGDAQIIAEIKIGGRRLGDKLAGQIIDHFASPAAASEQIGPDAGPASADALAAALSALGDGPAA